MTHQTESVSQTLMTQVSDAGETAAFPCYTIAKGSELIQGRMLAELIRTTVTGGDGALVHSPATLYASDQLPTELSGTLPEGTVLQMGSENGILAVACMPHFAGLDERGYPLVIDKQANPSEATIINVGVAIEDHCTALMKSGHANDSANLGNDMTPQNRVNHSEHQELDLDAIIGEKAPNCNETSVTLSQEALAVSRELTEIRTVPEQTEEQSINKASDASPGTCVDNSETPEERRETVVIDVTKPIQLSHNTLIVVNGKKCILQQCEDTGQIVAYPIKEPENVKRKRGRPRKQEVANIDARNVPAFISEGEEEEEEEETEDNSEAGFVEVPTEDGVLIRRSSRRRKKARFLQDYATGSLQVELGSEEELLSELELPEQPGTPPRKKSSGKGKSKKSGQQAAQNLGQQDPTNNLFPFLQQPKRGRGRPRRYGVPPASMQGFLIQTADGQSLMMQIPTASMPNHMSLQEVAENIALSLNSHMANQLAGLLMPSLKEALNCSDPLLETAHLGEQSTAPDNIGQSHDTDGAVDHALSQEQVSNIPAVAVAAPPVAPPARKRGRPRKRPLPPVVNNIPVSTSGSAPAKEPPEQSPQTVTSFSTNTTSTKESDLEFQGASSSVSLPSLETEGIFMVLNKNVANSEGPSSKSLYLTTDVSETSHPVVESDINQSVIIAASEEPQVSKSVTTHPVVSPEIEQTANKEDSSVTLSAVESVSESENVCEVENIVPDNPVTELGPVLPEVRLDTGQVDVDKTTTVCLSSALAQTTVIPLPEPVLPLLSSNDESPVKIDVKTSEKDLEQLRCSECQFQAYFMLQYRKHLLTHENACKCKCCQFVVLNENELLDHYKAHHPRNICSICNYTAEHAYIVKRHMLRHNDGNCKCPLCGKNYKDQYILKMHIKLVHMPASILFECFMCGKKFNRRAHLTRHLRTHDPKKPFKCSYCDYKSCEKSDLSKHMVIHNEPKHICELCGKAFRHFKNKEIHLKRHKGQRDFKCGICDFYGYTFTDIRKHIERRHTDSQTIICERCGQAFKTEAILKEHQESNQCEVYVIEQTLNQSDIVHMLEEPGLVQEEPQFVMPASDADSFCVPQTSTVFLAQDAVIEDRPETETMESTVIEDVTEQAIGEATEQRSADEEVLTPKETSEIPDNSTGHILVSEEGQFFTSNSHLTILTTPDEGTTQLALLSETGEVSTLQAAMSQEFHSCQDLEDDMNQPVTLITGEGLMLVV